MKIDGVYEHYGHSKNHLRYHIILVTKYRKRCLDSIKEQVFDAFKECCIHSHIRIHYMNTDKDLIHLLVSFPPEYSLSQTINRLKQFTTNYLYRTNNDYLRCFYYSKKKVLWTSGYFCSTIGMISESKVSEYIKNSGS